MNEKQLINFKQLRCFHAVAQEGSFTQAARALSVGQPSITTHVRALENHFGVELFCRHGHSVELTDLGRWLLEITKRIFTLEKEAAELLLAASGLKIGHLKIGVIGPFQVTQMIVAFNQKYPDVELSVSIGNSQEILESLLDFSADVAVLAQFEDDPRFFSVPYSRNRVIVVVSSTHPWSARCDIQLQELDGQRMVFREQGSATRRAFEKALALAKVNVRKVLEIESREAVRELVANDVGIGIALEDEFVPHERLHPLQIAGAEVYIHPHVVCLLERRNAPLIQAFLTVVKDLLQAR
jgi:aminoethylphosphonate catabolism LysR family transcriptional regulator